MALHCSPCTFQRDDGQVLAPGMEADVECQFCPRAPANQCRRPCARRGGRRSTDELTGMKSGLVDARRLERLVAFSETCRAFKSGFTGGLAAGCRSPDRARTQAGHKPTGAHGLVGVGQRCSSTWPLRLPPPQADHPRHGNPGQQGKAARAQAPTLHHRPRPSGRRGWRRRGR
jgi:hypothetical protein